jgi:hypothetical protein
MSDRFLFARCIEAKPVRDLMIQQLTWPWLERAFGIRGQNATTLDSCETGAAPLPPQDCLRSCVIRPFRVAASGEAAVGAGRVRAALGAVPRVGSVSRSACVLSQTQGRACSPAGFWSSRDVHARARSPSRVHRSRRRARRSGWSAALGWIHPHVSISLDVPTLGVPGPDVRARHRAAGGRVLMRTILLREQHHLRLRVVLTIVRVMNRTPRTIKRSPRTENHLPSHASTDADPSLADPSLRGFDREPARPRLAALDLVLGAPETRCPIADRAVRMVRGSGR